MSTPRECYNRVVRFQSASYIPNFDFGPISAALLDEWREQGMPPHIGFAEYFGVHPMEDYQYIRFDPIPGVPDQTPWPGEVRDEGRMLFHRDSWGRETESHRDAGYAEGARHVVRSGIRDRSDWDRLRDHFRADEPTRYPDHWDENNWAQKKAQWADRTWPLSVRGPSMIGMIKEIMGFETFSLALYDDPDLVEEIIETRTQLALDILGRAFDEVEFDVLHFWEDIAFNGGPILSPASFETLAVPRYRRLAEFFRSKGGEIVSVDSDGDIRKLIPLWLKAGVNHIWPMEVDAGMDVVALRKEYGHDFSMRGGFNKFALREGREAIDRELDRIAPVVADGGYIPSGDHQVPNGVRFDDYCYYMEKKRQLLGLA
jgi:uroporphyrinogen decarboxylase-like protein